MNIFLLKPRHFVRLALLLICLIFIHTSPLHAETKQPSSGQKEQQSNKILIVGDSLSSEYGIERNTGWVQRLRTRLAIEKYDATVINASISGDTTSGGLTRLPNLLKTIQPTIVLIELGGNDALRGLSLKVSELNLLKMIKMTQASGAKVVIAGMQIPPNYGEQYTNQFKRLYETITEQTNSLLIPFFLAGLETRSDLFISDNIHPNEAAQDIILNNVWPVLVQALTRP
jgi:acyl-CoA thioesterase I